MNLWHRLATVGPVGWLPVAPGTWGSAFAGLIWWGICYSPNSYLHWILIAVMIPVACYSADLAEKELGKDAKPIVIDEVVGQWIALLTAPHIWHFYIIGFLLFRLFDVIKPFPVYQSQRLPGGIGVVVDDVLAGVYAAITLLIIRKVFFA